MKAYLKVKIMSLAAEARIIRKLQNRRAAYLVAKHLAKGLDREWSGLHAHRRFDVRCETRSAHLAYGFLRGRPYRAMEAKCWQGPDWKRVQQLVEKFGEGDRRELVQKFAEWKDAA
ncbi:hypothetical protein [uncultured Alsobacter sp.]|uniref:hypothetical protein n=1 Tax=uncultured Alsobacter sp. TaxID=1748258 RepID=UPI0025FFC7FC|nr:hypothetical protein [uncultured Alsobacter sp.]